MAKMDGQEHYIAAVLQLGTRLRHHDRLRNVAATSVVPPPPSLLPRPTVAMAHEMSEPVFLVSMTDVSTAVVLRSQGSGGAREALVV